MSATICGYCGESFAEDQGQPACGSCPLRGGCHYVRCPHCGYENPAAPGWISRLRSWLLTEDARAADYGDVEEPRDGRERMVVR
jgi:hypothetical protein